MFELKHSIDPEYGDYCSARVTIDLNAKPLPKSAWGLPGRYVYHYYLQNPNIKEPIDWIRPLCKGVWYWQTIGL
jgi:maltooligosyltrehalose trehalohydrolase